ncbi:hypothetical protein ABEB36_001520 [Hypothenemus hampei]|uniref:Membrane insertase YidC/Oxa/ALB C-terminal domain-containing protein n=1 Tax=Hypothenemus hampei TaxID=57062 RepID=A0ABD1FI13_HYPHA
MLKIIRARSSSRAFAINQPRLLYGINNEFHYNSPIKNNHNIYSQRHYSFQNSIQSYAGTQSGIFKILSESTPVEYCQKFLLQVHDLTGLSWWANIIVSTIIVRSVVTLPVAVYQQIIVARLENIKLEMPEIANELKREVAIAVKLYNWDETTARNNYKRSIRKQFDNLIVRDNCHPLKTTVLLWIQIPLWISFSVSLRNLVYMLPVSDTAAQLTFTELSLGGFSVIPNLTIPDASWIFPITLGLINLALIETQILARHPSLPTSKIQNVLTNVFRGFNILMVPIAASVPSCLALYWTASSAYGLAQNLVLMSPKVRRLFRIPETTIEVKEPYQLIINKLKSKLKLT